MSIMPNLKKWKLIRSHIEQGALAHDKAYGPALWSCCSPAQCSAQALLLTAFCQMALRRWRMQELEHTQRSLMGDTKQFVLANIY